MFCNRRLDRYLILFPLVLLIIWASAIKAEMSDRLRVVANHLPPYMIISNDPEQPRYRGFESDLSQLLADELGLQVEFVECSWEACLTSLQKGHIDLVHALLRTPKREEFVEFLQPSYLKGRYATRFYQRFDDPRDITNFSDMVEQEMVVGYLGSTVYFPEFNDAEQLIKVDVKTIEIGMRLLTSKRIDALAGFDELFADFEQSKPNMLKAIRHGTYHPETILSSYTALSKSSPKYFLKSDLENALTKLTASGKLAAIKQKWIKTIH